MLLKSKLGREERRGVTFCIREMKMRQRHQNNLKKGQEHHHGCIRTDPG
jgi:hypothetical protein